MFKKGDTVQLKSGGPVMTVEDTGDYSPHGSEDGVKCVWFDGKKRLEDIFDAATLQPRTSAVVGNVGISR